MAPTQPREPTREHRLTVPAAAAGRRLDQTLALLLAHHSRNRLKAWIEAGLVRVDGAIVDVPRHKLAGGESLLVTEGLSALDDTVEAQAIALRVVHEDEAILVVDKPAGLVVHPGSGNRDGTLQNALLHHAPELAALPRAGIEARIDGAIGAYLAALASQPAAAWAFTIEVMGAGRAALDRRAWVLAQWVARWRGMQAHQGEEGAPAWPARSDAHLLALVGGSEELVRETLRRDGAQALPTLRTALVEVALAMLGASPATRSR